MPAKKCPICDETALVEKHGEFQMELPPNLPGERIVVPDATWLHCESCGEEVLSLELERAINSQCRRPVAVKAAK